MTDWRAYWNSAPARLDADDVLRQVGKTVNGQPVPSASLDAMADDIRRGLALNREDRLLDLCCGNGLLTSRCAAHCREVVGVDVSAFLIGVARSRFARPNVEYVQADACRLPAEVVGKPFTKICVYEALQHFTEDETRILLEGLPRSAPVFLGSVPDRERLWNFYDTPARRDEYHRRVKDGTEAIGHWWTSADLARLGGSLGYAVTILAPDPALHVAHYRFDALLTPR